MSEYAEAATTVCTHVYDYTIASQPLPPSVALGACGQSHASAVIDTTNFVFTALTRHLLGSRDAAPP